MRSLHNICKINAYRVDRVYPFPCFISENIRRILLKLDATNPYKKFYIVKVCSPS
jgi:hypothetical protein